MIELYVIDCALPALVDDSMASLQGYRWRLFKDGYVGRKAKGKRIYLHHVVLPGKRYPQFVRDHINRDKMDNQSSNLRWIPMTVSPQNRGAAKRNKLGLRGVMPIGQRYRATVTIDGVVHRFGMFDDPHHAHAIVSEFRNKNMPFAIESGP